MAKKRNSLTPKQLLFVQEYLVDLNATQAALRAGYSEKTAQVIGHENLSKPLIVKALGKAIDKRTQRTEVTADFVVTELLGILKIAKENGELAAALKSLEMLGKHVGMWSTRNQLPQGEGDTPLLGLLQRLTDQQLHQLKAARPGSEMQDEAEDAEVVEDDEG